MARKRFRQVIEGWFEDQNLDETDTLTEEEARDWLWSCNIISRAETGDKIDTQAEVTLSKFEILPLDPFHGVEESRGKIFIDDGHIKETE